MGHISHGRFKPSSVAGYERSERRISLERFCDLAELYRIPPDRLLAEILNRSDPAGRREIVIDLTRLDEEASEEARLVARHAREVKAVRADRSEIITLRSGDLQVLAKASGRAPAEFLEKLRPAVRPGRERGADTGSRPKTGPRLQTPFR